MGTRYKAQPSSSTRRGSLGMPKTPVRMAARALPLGANQARFTVASWPRLIQPASWAVRSDFMTNPAATNTRKTPVALKNLAKFSLMAPRHRRKPTPVARARPSTAPVPAASGLNEDWKAATMKTAVSTPSRKTARKAMPASANTEPPFNAEPAWASNVDFMEREFLLIHRIMNVTMTTATAPMTVSMASCCCWGRAAETSSRVIPMSALIKTAAPTPSHMVFREWPLWRRNAAIMPTIKAASGPSRRPITSVAST